MIQSDYALSYNVKAKALDILKSIYTFDTKIQMTGFVTWFNKLIEVKGRVTIAEICNKMKFDSIEPFSYIGFNSRINDEDIIILTRVDKTKLYQITFPILKDFTQKWSKP